MLPSYHLRSADALFAQAAQEGAEDADTFRLASILNGLLDDIAPRYRVQIRPAGEQVEEADMGALELGSDFTNRFIALNHRLANSSRKAVFVRRTHFPITIHGQQCTMHSNHPRHFDPHLWSAAKRAALRYRANNP